MIHGIARYKAKHYLYYKNNQLEKPTQKNINITSLVQIINGYKLKIALCYYFCSNSAPFHEAKLLLI